MSRAGYSYEREINAKDKRIAELEGDRKRVAERLRYLADAVPNDEMRHELHALARSLE